MSAVIAGQTEKHHVFTLVHAQLCRQIVAQRGGFRFPEIRGAALIDLLAVGKEHQLDGVGRFKALAERVALFKLLLAGHPQGLRRDLLEIPLPAKEQMHRIVLHRFLLLIRLRLVVVQDLGAAGRGVFLLHRLQLVDKDAADSRRLGERILQIGDLLLQCRHFRHPFEDILLVDVPQFDLRHELRLRLVDPEADHQVGNDLGFLLRFADDGDGLVDIQQDPLQTLQQVELIPLFLQHEIDPPPHALGAPGDPLVQNLSHAHDPGHSGDEDIEITAVRILQRRHFKEPRHQLVGIGAALEIHRQLQAAQIALITHIAQLPELTGAHQLRHLVHDRLDGGGVRDLVDLDEIFLLVIAPAAAQAQGAAARFIDPAQLRLVQHQLSAGGKIRRQKRGGDIVPGIFQQSHRGVAHLAQIEAADLARHTYGDSQIGAHQHVGERGGQKRGLGGGVVVVGHEIHRVAVQIPKQLRAHGRELRLGIAAGGVRHVTGIDLAEVALAVHKRQQQRLVTAGKAHHGVVNGGVAVGVEPHGLPHDVGGFGPSAAQKAHFIHGIEQFAVGRLEPVDLRDGAADDHAHGVGHEVGVQRFGDDLIHHGAAQSHHVGVVHTAGWLFFLFLLRHESKFLS